MRIRTGVRIGRVLLAFEDITFLSVYYHYYLSTYLDDSLFIFGSETVLLLNWMISQLD